MPEEIEKGTLYIVATPIGNLDDISFRAVKILSGVDAIAAEDTRKTRILLHHLNIQKELISYFSYNEEKRTPYLLSRLKEGQSIALVSDAGTPGISDPAFRIIRESITEGICVKAIPGAAAFLPALIVSGLPLDRFVFEGFLPSKKGRMTRLKELAEERRTVVLYESPHRIMRTLQEILQHFGEREMSVSRELTKKFEEVVRGSTSDVLKALASRTLKGEFVIVINGKEK
ncbi:MAG: 16S rRNA (cytidine(1402)-2'-O)-methyltransferase [Bacteroidota bacterium]